MRLHLVSYSRLLEELVTLVQALSGIDYKKLLASLGDPLSGQIQS